MWGLEKIFLCQNGFFILENTGTFTPHIFSLSIYGSRSLEKKKNSRGD
jgi:hypothetical protein